MKKKMSVGLALLVLMSLFAALPVFAAASEDEAGAVIEIFLDDGEELSYTAEEIENSGLSDAAELNGTDDMGSMSLAALPTGIWVERNEVYPMYYNPATNTYHTNSGIRMAANYYNYPQSKWLFVHRDEQDILIDRLMNRDVVPAGCYFAGWRAVSSYYINVFQPVRLEYTTPQGEEITEVIATSGSRTLTITTLDTSYTAKPMTKTGAFYYRNRGSNVVHGLYFSCGGSCIDQYSTD